MRESEIPFPGQPRLRHRWLARVVPGDDETCWAWTGEVLRPDQPRFRWPGRSCSARRLALEAAGVTIPAGHVALACPRSPLCVNPRHLRVGTVRASLLASPRTLASQERARTHCPAGHALGRPVPGRRRVCGECHNARGRASRRREA